MAGQQKGRGRQPSMEALEEKITKAQDRVVATKKAYDEAVKDLRELMDKRDVLRKDELYKQFIQSKWSYDQVIRLISSDPPQDS